MQGAHKSQQCVSVGAAIHSALYLLEGLKHEKKNIELCKMKLKFPNVFLHWGIMSEHKLDFVIFSPLIRP